MNQEQTINIFMYENVIYYPPTISLIQCLLNNGYKVKLVSQGATNLSEDIKRNDNFFYKEVKFSNGKGIIERIKRRIKIKTQYINELKKLKDNDILWTVNPLIIRTLGKRILDIKNKHVMQLMELVTDISLFRGAKLLRFDLSKYGRNAWKVVVPELNRAYIQKVGWRLKKLPYVLPNKPYIFNANKEYEDLENLIKIMREEKSKIIIYLGVIDPDRNFEAFAKAIENMNGEYSFYLFGKCNEENKEKFDEFCKKYKCVKYMGFVSPPKHLVFLKYSRIALLPYSPESMKGYGYNILNALYCAPNKIYEYSGYHIPMIGTDVLGLKEPFEKYNIGICCKDLSIETIKDAIKYVDKNHEKMVVNTQKFFDSINLDDIVLNILNKE